MKVIFDCFGLSNVVTTAVAIAATASVTITSPFFLPQRRLSHSYAQEVPRRGLEVPYMYGLRGANNMTLPIRRT